ncbi:unnamed protein product [Arabidopsis arenosa]|uniref:DUF4283 domain-containing protein n=1 Tax=Arabidopsis arenosa TaxID=38785 RepID=A0A8S2ABX9_ARAAE|nr:unnamed protein product [Arabidopsis arenosa]
MKSLLHMMPRIWGLEGKVAGADLGLGKFQFDFDEEEDIAAVLKMEPFHFDNWMVAMFWAEPIFRYIGKGLGHVDDKEEAVDLQKGRVQVTINGLKPLCFETEIEFSNGEATLVKLRYEQLHGYCELCFILCHESSYCMQSREKTQPRYKEPLGEKEEDKKSLSYRGAVISDHKKGSGHEGKLKGIFQENSQGEKRYKEDQRFNNGYQHGGKKPRADGYYGEGSSRYGRNQSHVQYNDNRERKVYARVEKRQPGIQNEVVGSVEAQVNLPPTQVRKSLFQGSGEEGREGKAAVNTADPGKVTRNGLNAAENPAVGLEEKSTHEVVIAEDQAISQKPNVENAIAMSTETQVSGPNALVNSGQIGEDVLMADKALEEDDLLEDRSDSSEQADEGLVEAGEDQMVDGEEGKDPIGLAESSEVSLAHKGVMDTGKSKNMWGTKRRQFYETMWGTKRRQFYGDNCG